MARIVPSDLSRLALAGAHGPEIETLARLEKSLPDEYGAILCIEQKNGPLKENERGLVKHYGEESKNVARQLEPWRTRPRDERI